MNYPFFSQSAYNHPIPPRAYSPESNPPSLSNVISASRVTRHNEPTFPTPSYGNLGPLNAFWETGTTNRAPPQLQSQGYETSRPGSGYSSGYSTPSAWSDISNPYSEYAPTSRVHYPSLEPEGTDVQGMDSVQPANGYHAATSKGLDVLAALDKSIDRYMEYPVTQGYKLPAYNSLLSGPYSGYGTPSGWTDDSDFQNSEGIQTPYEPLSPSEDIDADEVGETEQINEHDFSTYEDQPDTDAEMETETDQYEDTSQNQKYAFPGIGTWAARSYSGYSTPSGWTDDSDAQMSEGAQSPYDYSLSLEDFDAKSNGYNFSTYQDKPDTYAEMDTRMYQYTPLDYGFLGAGPLNTKPHSFFGTPYARLDINDAQGSDRPMESTNGAGVDESQPVAEQPDMPAAVGPNMDPPQGNLPFPAYQGIPIPNYPPAPKAFNSSMAPSCPPGVAWSSKLAGYIPPFQGQALSGPGRFPANAPARNYLGQNLPSSVVPRVPMPPAGPRSELGESSGSAFASTYSGTSNTNKYPNECQKKPSTSGKETERPKLKFQCLVKGCKWYFVDEKPRLDHMEGHHLFKRLRCPTCKRLFGRLSSLRQHLRSGGPRIIKCLQAFTKEEDYQTSSVSLWKLPKYRHLLAKPEGEDSDLTRELFPESFQYNYLV